MTSNIVALPHVSRPKRDTTRVSLVLDHKSTANLVGVVYGLEHHIVQPGYRIHLFLDSYNRRIKVLSYRAKDYEAMILKLRFLAEANRFDKIWIKASPSDWEEFLKHGYVLEGVLNYFNKGKPVYLVSKFRSQKRLQSRYLMEEILLIEEIMSRTRRGAPSGLPEGYELDFAREDDVDNLIELYRHVFESYPSPLCYREYLLSVLHRDSIFRVIRKGGAPVAVASAELDKVHLAAELTDCATHPDERGKGLNRLLLKALESDLVERRYRCAFSIARARSPGINIAFYDLGYHFNGRLINNCDIHGAFEDMNLWVKKLELPGAKVG